LSDQGKEVTPKPAMVESNVRKTSTVRTARPEDIATMVEIDMKNFRGVYQGYDTSEEEMRSELIEKFTGRFKKTGGDWIQIYEEDGQIRGYMMSCPTSKTPEEFKSWEQTTDDGTLETTYDPKGKNIYVVSLAMENCGEAARNRVFVNQIGKMVEGGYRQLYFESRLPRLRTWTRRQCRKEGRDFDTLTEDDKFAYANDYFKATAKDRKGNDVALDPLIRMYAGVGCTFPKIAANAYVDEPSMNFGVVGVLKNPMPQKLQGNRLVQRVVGGGMRRLSRMPAFSRIAEKMC